MNSINSIFSVTWLAGGKEIEKPYIVRKKVFIDEQKVDESIELDEYDDLSDHILIKYNSQPIATGRIYKGSEGFNLGRVAVLKEFRKKGLGRVVVTQLLKRAFSLGADVVYIHAQTSAEEFYRKLGFKSYGELFYEADIEHVHMKVLREEYIYDRW